MKDKEKVHSQGEIKQFWAESFDVEMDKFLLMPIGSLECSSCPENQKRLSKEITMFNFVKVVSRAKEKIRVHIWMWVVCWLEMIYAGSDAPNSSQIVDGCLAIKEGLKYGSSN